MGKLVFHPERIKDVGDFIKICPFNAIREQNGQPIIGDNCRLCMACVNKGPKGAAEYINTPGTAKIDKNKWRGIAVYAEYSGGKIHPVTFELIGKGLEMAKKSRQPLYILLMGYDLQEHLQELTAYGADAVYVYDDVCLHYFSILPYTKVFEDFIMHIKPSAILIGGTVIGRQLAPRVAARMHTGLTADCTLLDMDEDGNLIQVRPAFGGNIMAKIVTLNHRPQMATVRYKIMDAASKVSNVSKIEKQKVPFLEDMTTEIIKVRQKPQEKFIESADILIAAGRGVKKQQDLAMIKELADRLGGMMAASRPLIEAGWMESVRQIGLSGRTVRPKLIITCGISGAVQFTSGMENAETIIAINQDENAPIFKIAHYALIGDLYQIIPRLLENLQKNN